MLATKVWKGLCDGCERVFCLEQECCPTCGRIGSCSEHGSYARRVIDFVSGAIRSRLLWITRARCSSCGHTHALLAGHIVPYKTYSLLFILHVLYARFCKGSSLSEIYATFGIGARTFYRWARIFGAHCDEWLGRLKAMETGIGDALRRLLGMDSHAGFAAAFLRKTNRSFLQSHANPANCRQALPAASSFFRCSHDAP